MEILQEMLRQIDWKVLLPIFTFILGLSYSLIDKFLDRRRERNNLKTILFFEIAGNHYLLTNLPDFEKYIESKILWAAAAQALQYTLYDEYLGKISALNTIELKVVLVAYNSTKRAVQDGEKFMEFIQKNIVGREDEKIDNELLKKHSENLHSTIKQTQSALLLAVRIFVEGREDFLSTLQAMYEDLKE